MGNLLSRDGAAEWQPNIRPKGNNLNRPYSLQMQDQILQFAVPLMCIAALVYNDRCHRRKESELTRQRGKLLKKLLQTRQAAGKQKFDAEVIQADSIADTIKTLQHEEDKNFAEQMKRIEYYDKGLETFLDIKCSWFKKKEQRLEIQEDLLKKLSADANNVMNYLELKEVFDNDPVFCGNDRKSNGKLRQLYVKNWKLQVERDKYRNILEKLKHQ